MKKLSDQSRIDDSGVIHTLPLFLIVAAVGLISYLLISSTAPFNSGLFEAVNTKVPSQAATPSPTPSTPIKIMPLGDSITLGEGDSVFSKAGYRHDLYYYLKRAGVNFDFVGSMQSGTDLPDSDHEGHGGFTVSQIGTLVDQGTTTTYNPDIILLLIGTNNFAANPPNIDQAVADYNTLLDKIFSKQPNVTVVVGSIPPLDVSIEDTLIKPYNAALQNIVNTRKSQGKSIYFSDTHSLKSSVGGLHPSTDGYSSMAAIWFNTLMPILFPNAPAPTPTPIPGALPSPWQHSDIGIGVAGTAGYTPSTGIFTISGSGDDIGGFNDGFHYVYQSLIGDGSISARVDSINATADEAKTGVMIRENLNPNSINASMVVTPRHGIWFQNRTSTTSVANVTPVYFITPPRYVKLTRTSSTFTGYFSTDGVTWIQVGTATFTMTQNTTVGLAVNARDSTALSNALLEEVNINGVVTPTTSPSPTPICSKSSLGDTDCNGVIDIFDFNTVVTNFNKTGVGLSGGDFDGSGKVDIFDFNTLVTNFGH